VIERDELAAWLRLIETPQVGRETARRLLARFGSPQAVLDARPAAWREVAGSAVAANLAEPPATLTALIESTAAWLAQGERRAVVTLADAHYPSSWLETPDPPLLVYVQGRPELLARAAVAIVGSRNPTPQGRENASAFARSLSQAGLCIVSGLALGVDGAAHEGALEGAGSTIAVVGTGLDRVYPRRHLALAHRIAQQGLLVSEFALGSLPLAAHFPQRNRLIAGLASGTLVVEAALQSGSLITARLAAEYGREVFAVPGSIHAPQARGCHALIRQGAKLVEQASDILETPAPPASSGDAGRGAPRRIRAGALGFDPMTLVWSSAGTPPPAVRLLAWARRPVAPARALFQRVMRAESRRAAAGAGV
jgi:DNA processing protein